jgi:hypothetical protein
VEPPGGESGNIVRTWGMYNKPTGCSTPAYGAPHKQTNKPAISTGYWLSLFIFGFVTVRLSLNFILGVKNYTLDRENRVS